MDAPACYLGYRLHALSFLFHKSRQFDVEHVTGTTPGQFSHILHLRLKEERVWVNGLAEVLQQTLRCSSWRYDFADTKFLGFCTDRTDVLQRLCELLKGGTELWGRWDFEELEGGKVEW